MANKKDPSLERENSFEDDFESDLDLKDGELDDIFVDTEGFDSDDERKPINKMKVATASLSAAGRGVMGGAALGFADKVEDALPEVKDVKDMAFDFASDVENLKNETAAKIRPLLNQTKIASKQLLDASKSSLLLLLGYDGVKLIIIPICPSKFNFLYSLIANALDNII